MDVRVDCDTGHLEAFADIAIDANVLAQLKSTAPAATSRSAAAAPSERVASLEIAPRVAPFPLPTFEPFPRLRRSPRARARLCRRGAMRPKSARRKPFPCRRLVRLGSARRRSPRRLSGADRDPISPSLLLPGRPIIATSSRSCLDGRTHPPRSSLRRPQRAPPQPNRWSRSNGRRAVWRPGQRSLVQLPVALWKFGASPISGYDHYTAVYDISARVVYLPDGTKLEAHSGLGQALDNPRYVAERAVGPTPPHGYDLTLREGSFHGVQAIRLNPVGEGGIYGRAGLLAHPFMLGPNGDSNGCVSFRDYQAFLRAYENGQIKKLAVVARL